jgi:hypothetical protein
MLAAGTGLLNLVPTMWYWRSVYGTLAVGPVFLAFGHLPQKPSGPGTKRTGALTSERDQ